MRWRVWKGGVAAVSGREARAARRLLVPKDACRFQKMQKMLVGFKRCLVVSKDSCWFQKMLAGFRGFPPVLEPDGCRKGGSHTPPRVRHAEQQITSPTRAWRAHGLRKPRCGVATATLSTSLQWQTMSLRAVSLHAISGTVYVGGAAYAMVR